VTVVSDVDLGKVLLHSAESVEDILEGCTWLVLYVSRFISFQFDIYFIHQFQTARVQCLGGCHAQASSA